MVRLSKGADKACEPRRSARIGTLRNIVSDERCVAPPPLRLANDFPVPREKKIRRRSAKDAASSSSSSSSSSEARKRPIAVRPKRKKVDPLRDATNQPRANETLALGSAERIRRRPCGVAAGSERTVGDVGSDEASTPLLDLGKLVAGVVERRPSSVIKSPYVADVRLRGAVVDGGGDAPERIALAHAPALDVGGLCSPGATVLMTERPPGGKTSHSIELVSAAGSDGTEGAVLVGVHPRLGEALAEEVLRRGLLNDALGFGAVRVEDIVLKKQVTYGDSRVDFELSDGGKEKSERRLIEVKNVVCADFSPEHAPEKAGPNHCVIVAELHDSPFERAAIFPWGRVGQVFEGKKVVSERAMKHLRNLVDVGKNEAGVKPVVLFVVNRSDCATFRPCHEACPTFAAELKSAAKNGVQIVCFRVRWQDGKAFFDGTIPVKL